MEALSSSLFLALFLLVSSSAAYDGVQYDHTAYTECKAEPEEALYNGGIIRGQVEKLRGGLDGSESSRSLPSFQLNNLTANTSYSFSSWVKISGADSGIIKAGITTDNITYKCIGNVVAKSTCWSFLKGGFVQNFPSNTAFLYFEIKSGENINITIASASLQPFSDEEWRFHQQFNINMERKREVTIHVSDKNGERLEGATIRVEQISRDFPFGTAISKYIIGNLPYQNWFLERFNAAVMENELKWDATEPRPGYINYTIPDQMLQFLRANQITARGHNIFWDNPLNTPYWVRNLTGRALQGAVDERLKSVMTHYKNEFVHWDVNNEILHYDFYEKRLGPNVTAQMFESAHIYDPLATLFLNDYNVVEACSDVNSTVDMYIEKVRELGQNGNLKIGIGLEGHFYAPNPPMIRGILDKFATLGLPIWLTEIDISNRQDNVTQAMYLETVLREVYSHPAVNGIMLWASYRPYGCYRMCLTDNNFKNLPAGDTVDSLLKEWSTAAVEGETNDHGSFSFEGFLGEYEVSVNHLNTTLNSTFSVCRGVETRHFSIQL